MHVPAIILRTVKLDGDGPLFAWVYDPAGHHHLSPVHTQGGDHVPY